MPAPARVSDPSDLSDEALGCHVLGHIWWVTGEKNVAISIGRDLQKRRYFACARGCGSRKTALTSRKSGRSEDWGWSRKTGENYGTVGGWTKADFWEEVERRERADPDWRIPGPGFGFEFDETEWQIVPRRLRRGRGA
jgi:hypothetical protein